MVGIFSRLSVGRSGHRRAQSALDEREVLPSNSEVSGTVTAPATATTTATSNAAHGVGAAAEFKPVDHPTEPPDSDQPVECPLPEPSILNDGRIWKERISASMRRRGDLSALKEGEISTESESTIVKPHPAQSNHRLILPSVSAPEQNILKLLEECNASGM